MSSTPARPRVVIVGAGFGGLRAGRVLAGAPVDVHLLDRNNYHLFQPLLYQVATAGLTPGEIAYPVRTIFRRQKNLRFRVAEVTGVDLDGKRVLTDRGPIPYEFLILATGAETNFFDLESVSRFGFGLKTVRDAVAIRNHVLRCFELAMAEPDPLRRKELLTLVVVGSGPTGVELAGAFSELVRLVLAKDYPEEIVAEVAIVVLEAADRILPGMDEELSAAATASLAKKRVEVRIRHVVKDYDGATVTLADGSGIATRTLIWAAGARASSLAARLGLPAGHGGRLLVEPTLQVTGYPEVYVIGDAAYLEAGGKPLPMMAPPAIQMGDTAARNVLRSIRDEPARPFRYRDPGSLATIGRHSAVARVHGLKFSGFLAWVVWLVVHLIMLIGFRNRLIVLINWAWEYFLYERGGRAITPE